MSNKDKYNIYEKLNIQDFEDEEYLLDEIIEKADNLEDGQSVAVIAKLDLIEFLLCELIKEDFGVGTLELNSYSDDYYDEYYLQIQNDKKVSIEPLRYVYEGVDRFYNLFDTYVFMHEIDIKQDIVENALRHSDYPTLFGFENEYEEDTEADYTCTVHCKLVEKIDDNNYKIGVYCGNYDVEYYNFSII